MKSKLPILFLLLLLAAGLGGAAWLVMGGGDEGGGTAVVPLAPGGPPGAGGAGDAAQAGGSESPGGEASSVRTAVESNDTGAATQASGASPLTDSAELGPDEALLTVELRASEDDHALAEVTLLLTPEDQPDLAIERVFQPLARLGEAPRTDDRGRARFVLPAGRPFLLRASAREGVCGPAELNVRALRAGDRARVVLKAPTESDLRFFGSVVDAQSAEPISGASVIVRQEEMRRIRDRVEDRSRTIESTTTTSRGTFDVQVPSWLALQLRVEADGYAPTVVPIVSVNPDEGFTVQLARAATFAVRLVDENGAGLAGRTVELRSDQRALMQSDGAAAMPGGHQASFAVDTDEEGRARIENLPPDANLYLEVREKGMLVLQEPTPLRIASGDEVTREILLRQGLSLRGRMVDRRGWPVPRKELWMLPARAEGSAYIRRYDKPTAKTVTDSEGYFVFRDVAVGLWTLSPSPAFAPNVARGDRIAPVGVTVRVDEEQDPDAPVLELEVDRGLYVAGHVVNAGDKPMAKMRVTLTSVEDGYRLQATTGEDGAFSFGPLRRGDYRVLAESNSSSVTARETASAGTEDVKVQIGRGGVVMGTVVGTDGQPVPAEVTIQSTDDEDNPDLRRVISDDGEFRFGETQSGTYALVARTDDGRVGILRELEVDRRVGVGSLKIEVRRGGTVQVQWGGGDVPYVCTAEVDGVIVSFANSMDGSQLELPVPAGQLKVGFASEAINKWDETYVEVAVGETRVVAFP